MILQNNGIVYQTSFELGFVFATSIQLCAANFVVYVTSYA